MIAPAIAFARGNWKAIAGGVVLVAFLVLAMLYRGEKRHSAKVEASLAAEKQARAQDRASYQNAQIAAAAMNKAQVKTIEAEQEKINADVSQDYAGDLARLRAELGRVRSKADAPARSASSSAGAGSVPKPAQGSVEAPVQLPADKLLLAAETELQLNALITWVEAQGRVTR